MEGEPIRYTANTERETTFLKWKQRNDIDKDKYILTWEKHFFLLFSLKKNVTKITKLFLKEERKWKIIK